ncbi:hypothetical protein J3R82DRAFT_5120 [Butyriboletus roseoflavus]|nr:hypothetical protein J3R82DRAFT_5120 [Butyriboletus roseoflavus]
MCQKPLPETNAQWTSVLKLAIIWGFDTIRDAALRRLRKLSAVERVRLGEDFDLDFESWLLPAMHEIVRRHEPLSVEDAQRMGLETTLKLASARECVSSDRFISHVTGRMRRPNVDDIDFLPLLRKTFRGSSD